MQGFTVNLAEIIRRAQDEDSTGRPLPEAVAMTLQERFTELNDNPVEFAPGMLVTYKPGFERRKPRWAGLPMIVADVDVSTYPEVLATADMHTGNRDIALIDIDDGRGSIILLDRRWLALWEPPPALGPIPEPTPDEEA